MKCKLKDVLPQPGAVLPIAIMLLFFLMLFAIGGVRRLIGALLS